jgi:hypothetical protein
MYEEGQGSRPRVVLSCTRSRTAAPHTQQPLQAAHPTLVRCCQKPLFSETAHAHGFWLLRGAAAATWETKNPLESCTVRASARRCCICCICMASIATARHDQGQSLAVLTSRYEHACLIGCESLAVLKSKACV